MTECQIAVYPKRDASLKDFEALLFVRNDGYPGELDGSLPGIVPEIVPFILKFLEKCGYYDESYLAARLLCFLCDGPDVVTGHGIDKHFRPGNSYFYAIFDDRLEVWMPTRSRKLPYRLKPPSQWLLMKTITWDQAREVLKNRPQPEPEPAPEDQEPTPEPQPAPDAPDGGNGGEPDGEISSANFNVQKDRRQIEIYCSWDHFPSAVAALLRASGFTYDEAQKCWTAPSTPANRKLAATLRMN